MYVSKLAMKKEAHRQPKAQRNVILLLMSGGRSSAMAGLDTAVRMYIREFVIQTTPKFDV